MFARLFARAHRVLVSFIPDELSPAFRQVEVHKFIADTRFRTLKGRNAQTRHINSELA
jgi:hypothetical protein